MALKPRERKVEKEENVRVLKEKVSLDLFSQHMPGQAEEYNRVLGTPPPQSLIQWVLYGELLRRAELWPVNILECMGLHLHSPLHLHSMRSLTRENFMLVLYVSL
jgi:hypothetical protein